MAPGICDDLPEDRLPLRDHCDYCKAPCLFANVNVDRDIGGCYRCDKHLASTAMEVSKEAASQIELHIEFQQNMLKLLRKSPSIPEYVSAWRR